MGIKRIVDTEFWKDEKVIDFYSPEDKYFWLYLLTNPQTKQLGVYKLPKKIIAFEMGYSIDAVNVLLERFQNKYQVIVYSELTQEIAILNYLKYSIVKGGKPVIDCINKDINEVKDVTLLNHIYKRIKNINDKRDTMEVIKNMLSNYINDNDNDNDNDNIVPRYEERIVADTKKRSNSNSSLNVIIDNYSEDTDLRQALKDFLEMRKKIKKPMTERAFNMLLSKIDELAASDEMKIKLLDQSILHNWQTVYPLKEEKQQDKPKQSNKPNKFHNFIQSDVEEGDLEAIARKRFEKLIQGKKKE